LIKNSKEVTCEFKDVLIFTILDQVLKSEDLAYTIKDKLIMIVPKDYVPNENPVLQQGKNVSGKVSDSSGASLPGASVVVKGTQVGVITDISGYYLLSNVPENATLQFSFVGMKMQEVAVQGKTTLNVKLEDETFGIEEVVAIGYGTQRKKDLTGSVAKVNVGNMQNNAVANVGNALQGKLAGVEITPSSGDPRASVSIQIRGQGTFGANASPLIVIDGIITNQGLTDINYNNIQDLVVLKDASAAAIYGARGANGVILITTKRGALGKPKIKFSFYQSFDNVQRINEPVDNVTYATMVNEYFVNSGKQAPFTDAEINVFKSTPSTNWQDEIFRTALKSSYDFEASGGTEKNLYAISMGYFKGEGLVINHVYNRYNFRINNDLKLTDNLKLGSSLGLSYGLVNQGDPAGAIGLAMIYPSTEPAYYADGNFGIAKHVGEPVTMRSPLITALMPQNKSNFLRALFNTYLEYEVVKGLKFKTSLGIEYYNTEVNNFNPTYDYGTSNNNLSNTLTRQSNDDRNLQWDNTVTYNTIIKKNHIIDLLAGWTYQTTRNENLSGYRTDFPSNNESVQILNSGSKNDQARGSYYVWSLQSWLGRLNYSYKNKYLFTTNLRVDQSSRFPKENRAGVFPSFSLGWVLSEEDFLNGKLGPISFLKLRSSYGKIGNQDIGIYPYQSTLASNLYYTFGSAGSVAVGTAPTSNVNSQITWESTATNNIGVDLRLFKNKLSLLADYYNRLTSDVLVAVTLPSLSGRAGNPYQNIGKVRNRGFEFTAEYGNMSEVKDFTYNIGVNFSTNNNNVTDLVSAATIITQGGAQNQYEYRTEQGHEINNYFGYVQEGIFQSTSEISAWAKQPNAAPGDIKFKDLNNDGLIDSNDRQYIGSSQVHQLVGLNASARYKSFDISIAMNSELGKSMYILTGGFNLVRMGEITSAMYYDRWTGAGTSNYVPRLVAGDPNNNSRMSTFWLRSQNYLRIQNAQIGYNLPSSIISKVKMQSLRIYVAGQNLITWDKFPGYDPELGTGGYPIPRSIYIGCNIGF
jgi:TonB-linked SusC/RagA family outer membrane protein